MTQDTFRQHLPARVTTTCGPRAILVQVRTRRRLSRRRTTVARRQDDGPALPLYLSEPGRAVADYGLYLAARPLAPSLPRGDGHPVLVLPGLLADDVSTARAARASSAGWATRSTAGGSAATSARPPACVKGMRDKIDYLHDEHGRPVSLIGWSLGGIFARDLARRSPDAVRQVITLGSPFRHRPAQPEPGRRGCSSASRTCTSSTARSRSSPRPSRCRCPPPRSTRTSTGSCTGRPAWTRPASAARTSPSWPATSAWATTRRRSGRSPTGWPSRRATGSRSRRRCSCARRSRSRPGRPERPGRGGHTAA